MGILPGPSTGGKFKSFGLQRGRSSSCPPGASFCLRRASSRGHARWRRAAWPPPEQQKSRRGSRTSPPFQKRKKKQGDHRVPSTVVCGNRTSPPLIPRSALERQQHAGFRLPFNTKTQQTNFYLLVPDPASRYFLTFPLSLRCSVAPGAPPPPHISPSSGRLCPLPFGSSVVVGSAGESCQ